MKIVSQISSDEVIDFAWINSGISHCSNIFRKDAAFYRNSGGKLDNRDGTSVFEQSGLQWRAEWTIEKTLYTCEKIASGD